MKGRFLIGLVFVLAAVGQASGDWGWPPTDVVVLPANPTPSDVVTITLSGEWPNSCIPRGSAISVMGDEIFFDVLWNYPPGTICLTVITSWEQTESVGPLSPGAYSVYASLVSDPMIPGPYTLVTEFIVAEPSVPEIDIDVRPCSDQNWIVARPRWPVPVAILGSQELDVQDVDVATLAFGPGGASPVLDLTDPAVYSMSLRDVNDDQEEDLVAVFLYGEAELPLGESEACLTGEIAGEQFEACDTVLAVLPACGLGVELLFVLPPLVWLRGRRRRGLA